MQLDYNNAPAEGMAGMIADASPKSIFTGINGEVAGVPYGVAVRQGTADNEFLLPSAQGQRVKGVTVHQHRANTPILAGLLAIPAGEDNPLMSQGRIWVPVEDAVDKDAKAYYRHTANGGNTQLGKFRSDNDGVAQVTTVTPTAVNSTTYGLNLKIGDRLFHIPAVADSATTATEICDSFRAAIAANAALAALVTATGTATLILTGVNKGQIIDVVPDGSAGAFASITVTTPASTRADEFPTAKFVSSTAGAGFAVLELNQP